MDTQIVVARYNENINWLIPFKDITIIYNKGNNDINSLSDIVKDVASFCVFSVIKRDSLYNTTRLFGGSRYIFKNYAISSTYEQNDSEYLGDCIW